ncbi:hypothetical protein DRE_02591 [Drechslerella stenobrocha 248]|uniref:Uncharacterized protein n=1 Tax=Drechslerella stenobrocha 248 TaxID=1043628 RepID=W7I7D8_9PEZI|nr:hypothetical protein DRE_02591 [Drechslerella stenobrocha 248]
MKYSRRYLLTLLLVAGKHALPSAATSGFPRPALTSLTSLTVGASSRLQLSSPLSQSASSPLSGPSSLEVLVLPHQATTITSSSSLATGSISIPTRSDASNAGRPGRPDTSASSVAVLSDAPSSETLDDTNRITGPIITHVNVIPALTTFIQDDENPSSPLLPSIPTTNATLSCRNYPSKFALRACNTKLIIAMYTLAYIIGLRAVLWLQGLSARHVLELGERLARCRESYDGWAWEEQGSWKIKQQPDLPGVAMIGITSMKETPADGQSFNDDYTGSIMPMQDLDYRRQGRVKRIDMTPTGSQESINIMEAIPGSFMSGNVEGQEWREGTCTGAQLGRRRFVGQDRIELSEVVREAHDRIMQDTRPKRVFWGVGVSLLVIGGSLAALGTLTVVPCREVVRLGSCPFATK